MDERQEGAVQRGFEGLARTDSLAIRYFDELLKLTPEIKKYTPIAVIESLSLEKGGEVKKTGIYIPQKSSIKVFQTLGDFSDYLKDKPARREFPRGVVVYLKPGEFDGITTLQIERMQWVFGNGVGKGIPAQERRVFFVEKEELSPVERGRRKTFLSKTLGLTDFRPGASGPEGTSYNARPKSIGKKGETDMTESTFFGPAIEKAKNRLEKVGYLVLSDEKLRKSGRTKFPPGFFERIKDGAGMTLQSPCGCVIEVSLEGNITKQKHCDDPNCNGRPPQEVFAQKQEQKSRPEKYRLGSQVLTILCMDCGKPMERETKMGEINPTTKRWIIMRVTKCSDCGAIGNMETIRGVKPKNIIKRKKEENEF